MSRRPAGLAGTTLVVLALLLSGCRLPYERTERGASKIAITAAAAQDVYERYARVRQTALRLRDPQLLTSIETGPVLAVDSGALRVADRLAPSERPDGGQDLRILQVLAPRLQEYPLWFVAVVHDGVRQLTKVQIFTRTTSVSTWQLVASPETQHSVDLPRFALDEQGALAPVEPDDPTGLVLSPKRAVDAYVSALNAASAGRELPDRVVRDSFIQQMAGITRLQSAVDGISFTQRWRARPVEYALRTADGGALVFADLLRTDTYSLSPGTTVDWPDGSEQAAFLTGELRSGGQLSYVHQVLLYLPAQGGEPRALGQYGGIVAASGS